MTINTYYIGNSITLTDTITMLSTGDPADPTTLKLLIRDPNGTTTTKQIADLVRVDDGIYSYEIVVNTPGIWHYRFIATAPFNASAEKSFIVRNTEVAEPAE